MVHDDVVVVGGGLAGMTAALAATREGASVRLISHKKNTLRQASGLIDVLGYLPEDGGDEDSDDDGDGPLVDPFTHLDALPDGHPYSTVGESAVREGLAIFDDVTGDRYRGDHTDANALLPTFGGSVKPTARYPESAAAGLASREGDVLLVGFETLVDFDAPLAAAHLNAAGVPFEARGVTIRFPGDLRADAKVTRYAKVLDTDEEVGGTSATEILADAVASRLDGEERVGFPAVLGDEYAAEVRADLSAYLGVDVFEVPMGPPSLPGLRLEDAFESALREAGVAMETGNPAVGYGTDENGDVLTDVQVDRLGTDVPYHADAFVLATGGLVGKGVEADREGVGESVFDCHVPAPDNRYEWFEDGAFDDHAFARFGVQTDESLRPLDATDSTEFDNLYAAGSVLGGADPAREKSASGVSLATGFVAGINAASQ